MFFGKLGVSYCLNYQGLKLQIMKNIIFLLALALLSPVFLCAQAGQKTSNNNCNKTTPRCETRHAINNQKDYGIQPPIVHRTCVEHKESTMSINYFDYTGVVYCMEDSLVQVRHFQNRIAAKAFMDLLAHNPNCISYHIDR